ncbi:MAG TPA: isoprenyl transferase [Saprospiraceae bacterium]|jgi:undecaprenyl diphosphate synthase|nr:isoprenyl transferase [Saprospiraceae bacterium]HMT69406.1 isoprenyl transferase [Saprospiraceae bacterium]HQV65777.1 isoprenyl transferase [Saprospiraceae bacterium]
MKVRAINFLHLRNFTKILVIRMHSLKEKINIAKLPAHVAIIMDGNGRWAKSQGKPRVFGHKSGVVSVREVTEGAAELGVHYLTLYAFSTENWSRPTFEVNALMTLLVETVRKEVSTLNKNNIRLQAIGNLDGLPEKTRLTLLEGIDLTKDNTRMTLILALNYSSRWEIVEATKRIAQKVAEGQLSPEDIDTTLFTQYLTTKDIPDPELLIRTGGEHRISNYLLWQAAYAELFFTSVMWPDFRKEHFYSAILDYQNRERRFGMTSEQLSASNVINH